MPTSTQILLNELHLQMEYLLLELADAVLRPLAPRHHVAQVPDLRGHERGSSPTLDRPSPGASSLEKAMFFERGPPMLPPSCPRHLRIHPQTLSVQGISGLILATFFSCLTPAFPKAAFSKAALQMQLSR